MAFPEGAGMNALKTIGVSKAISFVFWELYKALLGIVVVPQLRGALLRLAGARIGEDTIIHNATFSNVYHHGFSRLVIGARCFVGEDVMLDVRGGITIEDDVTISNRALVLSHINVGYPSHPLQKAYPTKDSPVRIKKGSYVGSGAILLPGITLGAKSVVGAGSVVTKSVPSGVVVVGVPATVIKKLSL